MEIATREMTFEEEAKLYEEEARAEFAKETSNGDCSKVNGVLRRGVRIIRKARQEIASREVVRCCSCKKHDHDGADGYCNRWNKWTKMSDFCSYGEREDNGQA